MRCDFPRMRWGAHPHCCWASCSGNRRRYSVASAAAGDLRQASPGVSPGVSRGASAAERSGRVASPERRCPEACPTGAATRCASAGRSAAGTAARSAAARRLATGAATAGRSTAGTAARTTTARRLATRCASAGRSAAGTAARTAVPRRFTTRTTTARRLATGFTARGPTARRGTAARRSAPRWRAIVRPVVPVVRRAHVNRGPVGRGTIVIGGAGRSIVIVHDPGVVMDDHGAMAPVPTPPAPAPGIAVVSNPGAERDPGSEGHERGRHDGARAGLHVHDLRVVHRDVDHLRVGRYHRDRLNATLILHLNVLVLVALQRARRVRLLAQALDGIHHRRLIRREGAADGGVAVDVLRHHAQNLREVDQRDERRIKSLRLCRIGARLTAQTGVLLQPGVGVEDLLRIGRGRTDLCHQGVRIQRDRGEQLIEFIRCGQRGVLCVRVVGREHQAQVPEHAAQ